MERLPKKFLLCVFVLGVMCYFAKPVVHIGLQKEGRGLEFRNAIYTLNYSKSVNGVTANRDNMYITKVGYKPNLKPEYAEEASDFTIYQLSTYFAAGEIARHFNARYLVDIGCGKGSKIGSFVHEFHVIAADFGVNFKRAAEVNPKVTFKEIDLDVTGNCSLVLPEHIISQAVVVSADVIEHMIDPFYCYLKLMKQFSETALALVISTPDREYIESKDVLGPPSNNHHVREWTIKELEILLMDEGMYPVFSSRECPMHGYCKERFTPNNLSLWNQIHAIGNTQVRSKWLLAPQTNPRVTVFVIMRSTTNQALLNFNVDYLTKQDINVVVVVVGDVKLSLGDSLSVLHADNTNKATTLIALYANADHNQEGDWFLIQEAHEVLSFPQSSALKLSLKETLTRIGEEPYGFNAVALSTIFMQSEQGHQHPPELPFKMYTFDYWDLTWNELGRFRVPFDTLMYRVRIWKKGEYPVRFVQTKTTSGTDMIADVHYIGRRVYPFNALSLRYHPSYNKPSAEIGDDLRQIFALSLSVGFLERSMQPLGVTEYIY